MRATFAEDVVENEKQNLGCCRTTSSSSAHGGIPLSASMSSSSSVSSEEHSSEQDPKHPEQHRDHLAVENDTTKDNVDSTLENNNDKSSVQELNQGIFYGCVYVSLLVIGSALTIPHLQTRRDELHCDAMCWGTMTSVKSLLQLVGSVIIGRLSDVNSQPGFVGGSVGGGGRMTFLYIGTLGTLADLFITFYWSHSLYGMWMGMIPSALLQQSYSVLKALFSDYHDAAPLEYKSASARAGSAGSLGMCLGLSFMVGPLLGATVVSSYNNALLGSMVCTFLSGIAIFRLPVLSTQKFKSACLPADSTKKRRNQKVSMVHKMFYFLEVPPAARSSACIYLIALRSLMTLAYQMFNVIWTVSLGSRFSFGPSDHGKFMSFIGLTYALSQGIVAKRIIKMVGPHRRSYILMACCAILGIGRWYVFQTTSVTKVYTTFAAIVTALGLMNTIITGDTGSLAPSSDIGGVFGLLDAVQSMAGMLGPILAGVLAKMCTNSVSAILFGVLGLYVIAFLLLCVGYEHYIVRNTDNSSNRAATFQNMVVTGVDAKLKTI